MNARGSVAITSGARTLVNYVHCDAYPEYLGARVLAYAQTLADPASREWLRRRAETLIVVDEAAPMTAAHRQIVRESGYLPEGAVGPDRDYYSGLRELQGYLDALVAVGVFPVPGKDAADAEGWRDQPGHEYGYEINLDDGTFEAFRQANRARRWWSLDQISNVQVQELIDAVTALPRA